MKPIIDKTNFGWITIQGEVIKYDVIIRLNGLVERRRKKLSKEFYGTSHIISIAEAKYLYEDGAKHLIIGSGQEGMVKLSQEASAYFEQKSCQTELMPTPQAITAWNEAGADTIGLFHITC